MGINESSEDEAELFFDAACIGGPSSVAAEAMVEELTILVAKVAVGALLLWFSSQELLHELRNLLTRKVDS